MTPKVALVTGASSGGIGYSLCVSLRKRGYRVFATARNTSSIEGLKEFGCDLLQLDVTSRESLEAAVKHVSMETSGRLNALYCNAGAAADNIPVLEVDLDAARNLFEVNYFGVLACVQAFSSLLIETANSIGASVDERQAAIVVTCSITSIRPFPFRAIYGSSKAAVEALCASLRSELGGFGVHTSCVMTGWVATEIRSKSMSLAAKEKPTSYYQKFWPHLTEQIKQNRSSQERISITPDTYAEQVVAKCDVRSPPAYVYAGGFAWSSWLLSFGPVWLLDWLIDVRFATNQVRYEGKSA